MKQRIKYCDLLRFFAILSVIMIHTIAASRDSALRDDRPFYFFLTAIDSLTRAGVPIFFMISGMFLLSMKKEETYLEFFKKRVLKLFIPFFFVSIGYYVFYNYINGVKITVVEFLNLFATGMIKYHLWFMYDMILIYLLLPFFGKMVKALSEKELKTLILIIFIAGNCLDFINTITEIYFHFYTLKNFILPNFIIYMNYLFLGYYLHHYHKANSNDKVIYIAGIISLILMPIFDVSTTIISRYDLFLVARSMLPFIFSLALVIFVKNNYQKLHVPKIMEDFCSKYAGIVFYIYMFHVIVLDGVRKYLLLVFQPSSKITTLLFVAILFILTSIISFIVSYIYEVTISYVKKKMSIFIN